MLDIEGKVVVGNNDAKDIKANDSPKIEQHHKNLSLTKIGSVFQRFFIFSGPRGCRQKTSKLRPSEDQSGPATL